MSAQFVITGTDTDIGKTVFAAALTAALGAHYWKPVQAGVDDGTDTLRVLDMGGLAKDRVLAEAYCLQIPASPHYSAEQEGVTIDPNRLAWPDHDGSLIVEGAGGALVPVTRDLLYADLFASWGKPAIIVARTALGTINHSLMTVEVLRSRKVPIHGIAFVGDSVPDSERTICEIGRVKRLGRLPMLDRLTPDSLAEAFAEHFNLSDFSK